MQPYHLRRKDKELSDPTEHNRILATVRTVTLAMSIGDEPYAVVLNHGWDPERRCLYFHCAPRGKKIDILSRNPRVWGVAVQDLGYLDGRCDHAYRSVMFSGNVTWLRSDGEKRRALEVMIHQHESNPEAVIAEQLTPERIAATCLGRIDVEHISGKEALP